MIPKTDVASYLSPLSPVPTGMSPRGRVRKPLRSLLFDVYGTLFISGSGDIGTARQQAQKADLLGLLKRFGISSSPLEMSGAFFSEIEAVHARSRAAGIDFPEVEIDRIWMSVLGIDDRAQARRFAVEYELVVNPVYPMPGLKRLLDNCRKRGLAMGIISNAQFFTPWLFSWFLGKLPADLGFEEDLQIYSFRLGRAKPSPDLFEKAQQGLAARGIDPGEALFVGNDMRNDVAAGQRAGFQTALFAGDARSLKLREEDPNVREVTPDLVITELWQIMEPLKSKVEEQNSELRTQNSE